MVGPFWMANIALVMINTILLGAVLFVYVRNFGKLHSKFVLGLMTFAFLLMVDNLVAAYMYFDLAKTYGVPVAAPLLVINVVGMFGFVTLLWTTLR